MMRPTHFLYAVSTLSDHRSGPALGLGAGTIDRE